MGPGFRVRSREIGEGLCRSFVAEAFEPGSIVVGDEVEDISITLSMVEEAAVVGGAVFRHSSKVLTELSIEALDHAVGLWPEGPGQLVTDSAISTQSIDGMFTRRLAGGLSLLVDGEGSVHSLPLSVRMV